MLDERFKITIVLVDEEAVEDASIDNQKEVLKQIFMDTLCDYSLAVEDITVEHIQRGQQ